MKTTMTKSFLFVRSALLTSLLSLIGASMALASIPLPPGSGPTPLPGATAAIEADLGGTVIFDKVYPFAIRGGGSALLFAGQLQNRVVKSARTGELHFYYRIRDTKQGLNGIIHSVRTQVFANEDVLVDWRPDGLGAIHPVRAERSPGSGAMIQFDFGVTPTAGPVLVGGTDSKFFFIKTEAKNYQLNGRTTITLATGQSITLGTAAPVR
jgi:hypothetical protein